MRVNPKSWYVVNVDDGIIAGPFRTKRDAMWDAGADRCKKEVDGLYRPITCDGDESRNFIGTGYEIVLSGWDDNYQQRCETKYHKTKTNQE